MVVAPASMAARQTSATKPGSDRVASSHANSTSSTRPCTYETAERACSTTSSGSRTEFELHVDRARREHDVHTGAAAGLRERLDGCVEILVTGSRERGDGGAAHGCSDGTDALEVAR
jgi:hypothetical protein